MSHKEGRIKIADFGIARMLRTGAGDMPLPESDDAALDETASRWANSIRVTYGVEASRPFDAEYTSRSNCREQFSGSYRFF